MDEDVILSERNFGDLSKKNSKARIGSPKTILQRIV